MRTTLILSGGLDSTVLLFHLRREHDVRCVSFNYGQRHGTRELEAAREIAMLAGVQHQVLDLTGLSLPSALTTPDAAIPLGHYADASMKATVVPNRNMIMLAVAAGIAIGEGREAVAYAAHAGDHTIYPDCRPAFVDSMAAALLGCDWQPITLLAPFITWTKADIARHGVEVGAPLDLTWSCYQGGELHCGKCGTCHERREAFTVAGVVDPTRYAG